MSADSLKQYTKANCFMSELAQADMCSVDLTNIRLYVDKQTSFVLTLCDSSGTVCHNGENQVDIYLVNNHSSSTKGDVQPPSQGQVKVFLTPKRRGQHQLNVKVNGTHIKNSPFAVTTYMPPQLLSQPVATMSGPGLERPAGLAYSQAEDKVLATVLNDGTIIKVDSGFHSIQIIAFPCASEITQGADLNIFYATTTNNRLHKITNDGRIIKSIGQTGKRNAQFNYTN